MWGDEKHLVSLLCPGQVPREVENPVMCSGSAEACSTTAREWEFEQRNGTGAFKSLSTLGEHRLGSADCLLLCQPGT